jgi:hypothetical protein
MLYSRPVMAFVSVFLSRLEVRCSCFGRELLSIPLRFPLRNRARSPAAASPTGRLALSISGREGQL